MGGGCWEDRGVGLVGRVCDGVRVPTYGTFGLGLSGVRKRSVGTVRASLIRVRRHTSATPPVPGWSCLEGSGSWTNGCFRPQIL
jgi:hypothetical protein